MFVVILPFILFFALGSIFNYISVYATPQIFNIQSPSTLILVLFTYIPSSIGLFILLASFFFISTWIGMIPVYLYTEFMMNKKQKTVKNNPVQIQQLE